MTTENYAAYKEVADLIRERLIDDLSRMVRLTLMRKKAPKSFGPTKSDEVAWSAFKRKDGYQSFTDLDFEFHFFGDNPECLLGSYSIDADGNCKLAIIDIDGSKNRGKEDDLAKDVDANDSLTAALDVLNELSIRPLLAQSKSGSGYHIRVLFEKPIPAARARRFLLAVCRAAGLPEKTEVFPKQDSKDREGSQVALPGGHWWNEHRNKRYSCASWFIDHESWQPIPFEKWPEYLRNADLVSEERLAAAEKKLEEMGQAKNGKSPFDPISSDATTSSGPGERRRREPRSDAMSGDPSYDGWLPSDMEDFLTEHGFGYEKKPHKDGSKFILNRCPWNTEHSDAEDNTGAATFIDGSGVLGFKCHHAHCENRKWRDFRQTVDPNRVWKRRERPCGGKKFEYIYCSSQRRAEEKKAKRAALLAEAEAKKKALLAEAEAKKAALRDGVADDVTAPGAGLAVGLGVTAATRAALAATAGTEPAQDDDVATEEALAEEEAEKLKAKVEAERQRRRASDLAFRNKITVNRATRQYLTESSPRRMYDLYATVPRSGEVDPETGEVKRPADCDDEQDAKVRGLNRAHQETRYCRTIRYTMVTRSGKTTSVPHTCDRTGCCVQCADRDAVGSAEWAAEHWPDEPVTLVESTGAFEPRDHEAIEKNRKAAIAVVKVAEKGPKKPRKKRKKALLGAEADAAMADAAEPAAEKEKIPWRYFDGFRHSVVVGPADLHEKVGARFQPGGPKTAAGYAADVVSCSEGHSVVQVTSRVVTKREAIRIIFGVEVGEHGEVDAAAHAAFDSVWMEPSVELLARDRALEAHLRTRADNEGDDAWEAGLERLTLRCFAHPYIRVKKKKRTSGNKPGKAAFSLPTPAEMRTWKKEKRALEHPELPPEVDEEKRKADARHYGKVIWVVEDPWGKEYWQCAQECARGVSTHLSMVGRPGYDLDTANQKCASTPKQTLEEMQTSGRVNMHPAYGCAAAASPRAAFASAG